MVGLVYCRLQDQLNHCTMIIDYFNYNYCINYSIKENFIQYLIFIFPPPHRYRTSSMYIYTEITVLSVLWCFVHVCFVQVTILKLVWRSWRADAPRALSSWYLFCDPRRWDNSRKVRAPRGVSASGAPHVVTCTKQTWTEHQCTVLSPLWISISMIHKLHSKFQFTLCQRFLVMREAFCKSNLKKSKRGKLTGKSRKKISNKGKKKFQKKLPKHSAFM